MTPTEFLSGGYCCLPGGFQYSAGVAALPGFRIERVAFREPAPLLEGFRRAEEIIRAAGRPLTAFCACELRSPAPFSEHAFRSFNETYVGLLDQWELIIDSANPVARSNVCPELFTLDEPVLYAFCYTARAKPSGPTSFVISGSGEVPEGKPNYRDHIVKPGDVSLAGMRAKVRFVRGEMERRLAGLGMGWRDVTATQLYSIHCFYECLRDELIIPGAARYGLIWQFCRPPIIGLDFEMDCRCVASESVFVR